MGSNGDAAEQIVRLSLEGMEATVKIAGTASKHLAVLLYSILRQEQKTRGKARLTSMIKSGKELKVFAIQQKDLATFVEHAKQYGVLYCIIQDKNNNNPNAVVDVISRAEDAAKIQRIYDRYGIGKVEAESITKEEEKEKPVLEAKEEQDPFMEMTDKNGVPSEKSLVKGSMQDRAGKQSVKNKLTQVRRRAKQSVQKEMIPEVLHHEEAGR